MRKFSKLKGKRVFFMGSLLTLNVVLLAAAEGTLSAMLNLQAFLKHIISKDAACNYDTAQSYRRGENLYKEKHP